MMLSIFLVASPVMAGPGEPAPALPAGAAQPADATIRLTWRDVVALVDRHPQVAAARFRIEAARGGVSAAGAVPNPLLEGDLGQGFSRTDSASRLEWGLSLTMPLGWLAQRTSRVAVAEAEVAVALAESRALRRDVLLQLGMLFWSLAYEQARVVSLEESEAQAAALVEAVKKRVDGGEIRPVEATRVEIEAEKIRSELELARAALQTRRAELRVWLGAPADANLVVVADLESLPVTMGREAAVDRVRATHPALAVSRARTRFLEAEVGAERAARVPSFSISVSTAQELDRRAYGAGVAIDLPLWDWNSGRIDQAEARLAAERQQAEVARREVEVAVLGAQAACQASVAAVGRFRANVVPRIEVAAFTMEKTYQLGETNLLDVIDARRTLIEVRRLYLSALAQAQIDCHRLGTLVGEEPQ